MAATTDFLPATEWSSCSVSLLKEGFDKYNLDRCLFNEPSKTVKDPVCGNGVREGKEECDCGSRLECTDPCCNPNTCQLASGAQCSAGPCCNDKCQFVPYGTQCRAAVGECDIAEFCSGESSECPKDNVKLNGIPCSNGSGYCFMGECPTHNSQCQLSFSKLFMHGNMLIPTIKCD